MVHHLESGISHCMFYWLTTWEAILNFLVLTKRYDTRKNMKLFNWSFKWGEGKWKELPNFEKYKIIFDYWNKKWKVWISFLEFKRKIWVEEINLDVTTVSIKHLTCTASRFSWVCECECVCVCFTLANSLVHAMSTQKLCLLTIKYWQP